MHFWQALLRIGRESESEEERMLWHADPFVSISLGSGFNAILMR